MNKSSKLWVIKRSECSVTKKRKVDISHGHQEATMFLILRRESLVIKKRECSVIKIREWSAIKMREC